MKFQMLEDKVMVRRLDRAEKSRGGIILPDVAQEPATQAIVVSVGPGRTAVLTGNVIPPQVKEGDLVLIGKYSGDTLGRDIDPEQNLLTVTEGSILCVFDPEV
jgi:chaperonin GroES